jgi:hypothetical protein
MKKVCIDSDLLLDVALGREPFFTASKGVLALAENDLIIGNISSNCVAKVYYILKIIGGDPNARKFISTLVNYISVIPMDH